MKPLFCLIGKSASGKTTIANILEEKKYGYRQVLSYTTRPPRYDGEIGHIFVSEEDFDNLGEFAGYTEYNGYRYGTTFDQLKESNIYVIDVPGIETLLRQHKKLNRAIRIIYFSSTVYTRINRMINRGSSDTEIVSRLLQDEEYDWYKKLDSLTWHYDNNEHADVDLYKIDANMPLSEVVSHVMYYINKYEE